LLAQFGCAIRGGFDGIDQGRANAAGFKGLKAGDCRAARACDLVFQDAWMQSGFQKQLGRAEQSLRREKRGDIARQADAHTAVAQCLDHHKHKPQLQFALKVPEEVTAEVFPRHARYGPRAGMVNESYLNADALAPTRAGVLGMTRMIRRVAPSPFASCDKEIPAAMETIKC